MSGKDKIEELEDLLGAGELLKTLEDFAKHAHNEANRLKELASQAKDSEARALLAAAAMDQELASQLVKMLSPLFWSILTLLNSLAQSINKLVDMIDLMVQVVPSAKEVKALQNKLDEISAEFHETTGVIKELMEIVKQLTKKGVKQEEGGMGN
jgi:phage-related minor tail protein